MASKWNGRTTTSIVSAVISGSVVFFITIGFSDCRGYPEIKQQVSQADIHAMEAIATAESLRVRIRENEKQIAGLCPKVGTIEKQVAWMVNVFYEFAKQRGLNPLPPPAPQANE